MGLLYCLPSVGLFFCLDWVCFTFRIDVGLFCGLALLQIFFFFFSDFSSKIFWAFFFFLKKKKICECSSFCLRVFLIFFLRINK